MGYPSVPGTDLLLTPLLSGSLHLDPYSTTFFTASAYDNFCTTLTLEISTCLSHGTFLIDSTSMGYQVVLFTGEHKGKQLGAGYLKYDQQRSLARYKRASTTTENWVKSEKKGYSAYIYLCHPLKIKNVIELLMLDIDGFQIKCRHCK